MQTTEILCTLFKECYENHFFFYIKHLHVKRKKYSHKLYV